MKKKQGSIELEVAEGGGEIELTVIGNQVGLGLVVAALKERIKSYGLKKLDRRRLTLMIHISAEPAEDEEQEAREKQQRDRRYPDHKNPEHNAHVNV